jgi:hypothetical protein
LLAIIWNLEFEIWNKFPVSGVFHGILLLAQFPYFCTPAMKNQLRIGTVLTGAFLALVIVLVQLFHFQAGHKADSGKRAKTEQKENQAGNEASYNVLTSFSLPSPAYLELDTDLFCLFEIGFEQAGDKPQDTDVPHYCSKFLQTLFRVIISPNAP